MTAACFGRQPLPPGTVASNGDKMVCVVDKITQFAAELAASGTDAEERLMALKFILHFVGDVHQPLHASDDHDSGGNDISVIVDGFQHEPKDELHGYWDTQFVDALVRPSTGIHPSPSAHSEPSAQELAALANKLLAQVTSDQAAQWSQGTLDDRAMEAFKVSVSDAYGHPPLSPGQEPRHLDAAYAARAEKDIALQLSRAGVRLGSVLNKALGRQ
jgi:hypothetical protein